MYFNTSDKRLYCPASKIKHETIEIDGQKPYWVIPEYRTDALEAAKPYYLYLQCSKDLSMVDGRLTGDGVFFVSEDKIKVFDMEGYYVFWVTFVNSENEEGDRSFTTMYGLAELLPGQLTVDTLRSSDGKSFWKALKNQFRIGSATSALEWNIIPNLLRILNASLQVQKTEDGQDVDVAKIDGDTGSALFGKGNILLNSDGSASFGAGKNKLNADGSFSFADGNFIYDLIDGLLMTGKFESNKAGNKIIIDPSANRKLKLINSNGGGGWFLRIL